VPNRPIALDAYERLADGYAARIDTKPHNAYYERPTTLALLPDVKGKRVLDAGCGPGLYTQLLLERGAQVVAVDISPSMVAHAQARSQGRAEVRVADLAHPLDFLPDASIDVVLCPLVLEYVKDWRFTLGEFFRALVPGGVAVVSVTHPFFDLQYFGSSAYFDTELVRAEWRGFGRPVEVPSYRRPLGETLGAFTDVGFVLTRVVEPRPTEAFRAADPRHYDELMQQPAFLHIQARKPRPVD
jgi:SAM-dependent methyltransferase